MKKVYGLIIIAVMLGSSLLTVLYSIQPKNYNIKLPPNIVDYKFDSNMENILIANRYTIITFIFGNNCMNCSEILSFLEDFVNRNRDQIFLQKIFDEREKSFYLEVKSYLGAEEVKVLDKKEVLKVLCSLIYIQTTECLEV